MQAVVDEWASSLFRVHQLFSLFTCKFELSRILCCLSSRCNVSVFFIKRTKYLPFCKLLLFLYHHAVKEIPTFFGFAFFSVSLCHEVSSMHLHSRIFLKFNKPLFLVRCIMLNLIFVDELWSFRKLTRKLWSFLVQ